MRTLVTGGTGFVGFNVVEALLGAAREVVIFDRGALHPAHEAAVAPYRKQLTYVQGDLRDAAAVSGAVAQSGVDGIIHCAAMTAGTERETTDPTTVVQINLVGTINVLDAARKANVRRVVYANSGSVYGETLYKGLPRLYEDSSVPVPVRLYSITKQAAERTCIRMRELWHLDVVSARLGNVFGPWERDTGVRDRFEAHSQLVALAASGETAVLPRSDFPRDLVYVRDVAAGLIALLDAKTTQHAVYNLSAGQVWRGTLEAWARALKNVFPAFTYRVAGANEKPNVTFSDGERSPMDMGRMEHELGFRAREQRAAWDDFLEWVKRTPAFHRAAARRAVNT